VDKTALSLADEVFVCNALMPVLPVIQIDQQTYPLGELTRRLAAIANEY
jgi:4-amino-4-deoxychorismate lyase